MAVTEGCYCFLFQKIVKRSIECHVLAQSPPGRRPNDKYPVNTSHRSDLCKNVSLQCCLVATVMHIQRLHSHIYIYICVYIYMCVYIYIYIYAHILLNMEMLVEEKKYTHWDSGECRLPRKSLRLPFWARVA